MVFNDNPSGLPPSVLELIDRLAKFPGVGKKSAQRMALHVLRNERDFADSLAASIVAVKDKVAVCQTCWMLSEEDPCTICSNHRRDHSKVCLVEDSGDVIAIEKTGGWSGLYHVLGGAISPLDNIGPEQLQIDSLIDRIRAGGIEEIVVATNPTSEGETTALYIARLLQNTDISVTRIARGIPVGADIELVDDNTLTQSLENRTEIR
jgi:recombination protein RecR